MLPVKLYKAGLLALVLTITVPHSAWSISKKIVYSVSATKEKSTTCKYNSKTKKWTSSDNAKALAACKKLGKLGTMNSLAKLPDTSQLAKKGSASSSSLSLTNFFGIESVSGTPPLLASIGQSSIKNTFWRDGIVDVIGSGSPSQAQCGEFYSGSSDGESGGFNACHAAETVGYTFENIAQTGASLCYMKNTPTQSNRDAGGITITSGSLPNDDITKLFSPPTSGGSRFVKVSVENFPGEGGPEELNLKVYSASQNSQSGNTYRVDMWQCDNGNIVQLEKIKIKLNGDYFDDVYGAYGPDTSVVAVRAGIVAISGGFAFDPNQPKTINLNYSGSSGSFKSNVQVFNGSMEAKSYSNFGGLQKDYSVLKFTGSDLGSMRFTQGANKSLRTFGDSEELFTGATEYRNSYYASAPNSSVIAELGEISLNSSFYSSGPDVNFDTSGYDCDQVADVAVTMDFSNSTLLSSVVDCESDMQNMHFCHDDSDVQQADSQYFSACISS